MVKTGLVMFLAFGFAILGTLQFVKYLIAAATRDKTNVDRVSDQLLATVLSLILLKMLLTEL